MIFKQIYIFMMFICSSVSLLLSAASSTASSTSLVREQAWLGLCQLPESIPESFGSDYCVACNRFFSSKSMSLDEHKKMSMHRIGQFIHEGVRHALGQCGGERNFKKALEKFDVAFCLKRISPPMSARYIHKIMSRAYVHMGIIYAEGGNGIEQNFLLARISLYNALESSRYLLPDSRVAIKKKIEEIATRYTGQIISGSGSTGCMSSSSSSSSFIEECSVSHASLPVELISSSLSNTQSISDEAHNNVSLPVEQYEADEHTHTDSVGQSSVSLERSKRLNPCETTYSDESDAYDVLLKRQRGSGKTSSDDDVWKTFLN